MRQQRFGGHIDTLGLKSYRHTIAAAIVSNTCLALFAAASLWLSLQKDYRDATADLDNMTLNLSRQFSERFQAYELALNVVTEKPSPSNAEEMAEFKRRLASMSSMLAGRPTLRFVDKRGVVHLADLPDPEPSLQISDRQFFQNSRRTKEMQVGLPVKSLITGLWVFPISMAMRDASGEFGGLVYIALELAEVERTLAGMNLGHNGVSLLASDQGEMYARSSAGPLRRADEQALGKVSPTTLESISRQAEALRYDSVARVDNVLRLTMYRRVGRYPLIVVVGLDKSAVVQRWHQEIVLALALWLGMVAASLAFVVSQRRMGQRLSAMFATVGEARQQAEEANAAKTIFLSSMSHEIRTPLNAVLGFAHIGRRSSPGAAESLELFTRIVAAGRLLQGIVNDILDLAKIESGKLVLHEEPTNIRRAVDRAVDLVQEDARAKSLDLVVDQTPGAIWAMVDPLRLQQILVNLLANAVKFTAHGEVAVEVRAAESDLKITVIDTGIGMSEYAVQRLFVPFQQADGSITRRYGGSGLGLTIAKRLLESMGGTIVVHSVENRGSRFTVRVPWVKVDAEAVEAAAARQSGFGALTGSSEMESGAVAAAPPRLTGLHILVAEDNEVNQILISQLLKMEGASCDLADDGTHAVEKVTVAPNAFDVALIDIMMPGIDGYETARQILSLAPHLPVIAQTASALTDDFDRCLAAGMTGRIVKPIEMDALVTEITIAIRTAKMRRERTS